MRNSKKKIITVIVAAYKAEDFIHECLASIIKQKLPRGWRLQLILGIDCCEKTREAVEKLRASPPFNRSCLEVYYMQKNRGTYVTFNTMMQFAKGSVICRFDADDVMCKDFLKDGLLEVKQGSALLTFKCKMFPLEAVRIPHGILMFTKTLWDAVGGFQPWRCGADTDFLQRVGANPSLVNTQLKDRIYFHVHRRNNDSLTTNSVTGSGTLYRDKIQNQVYKSKGI